MSPPLLATKLSIPSTSKHPVERPFLISKLDECLEPGCRLALISAPAGFGKTTLVSGWISRIKSSSHTPAPSVAWVSLDARDNDPVLFWSYTIASLQTQQEEVGKQSLSLLQLTTPLDLQGSLTPLINDLAKLSNLFILVLDDYHLIRNPIIHESLTFLLEHTPSQFHVVLASRIDPPLPLALLRGRGQLVEIRLNDLRFSVEDAGLFLISGMSLNLSPGDVEALHQKTEGWIAGLQMAAISLREASASGDIEKITRFITSFSGSNRYILDYLIEEVLSQQSPEIQNFLLKTSILDRMRGSLCDALLLDDERSELTGSQEILERLETLNLFIFPLDDQRIWYRYHQLFKELLGKRLSQIDPGEVAALHQRAIRWYEQNGMIPKAVEHAFQIKDYPKAASLVSQISEEIWGRGEHATLLEWITALPEDQRRQYPQLWVWQVSMLITAGKIHEAERRVQEIEAYLQTDAALDPNHGTLMGRVYSLRTYIASFYKDIPKLLQYARLALENMTGEEHAGGRCGIYLVLSNAYLNNGDLEEAGQMLVEAIDAGRKSNRPYMVLTALENLANVYYTQGDLTRASQVCQEGFLSIHQLGLERSHVAADLYTAWGIILCERHDLDEAEQYLHRGRQLARERGYIWSQAFGYRGLIRLQLARRDLSAAESIVLEAEQLASLHEIPDYHACGIAGLKAITWVRLGKIEQAEEFLSNRNIRVDCDIQFPHESEFWAFAMLCLAKGDLDAGAGILERLLLRAR
jgi:LuxR family maltose regulon positive regulatory protein